MKTKRYTALFWIILLIAPIAALNAEIPEAARPGFQIIDPISVYNICKELASEKYAGRFTGHEGYTAAAQWAAGLFKTWGMTPMDDKNGFLQPYPSPYSIVDAAEMTLYFNSPQPAAGETKGEEKQREQKLETGNDFLPAFFSDSGSRRGQAVFLGWGIHAPELGYSDYDGQDTAGKFILCFRGVPNKEEKRFEDHDQHRHRLALARERGALGLIYIYPEPISMPNGDWQKDFLVGVVSFKIADDLLKEKAVTAEQLEKMLKVSKKPNSFQLPAELAFSVTARRFSDGVGYNVVGIIPGADPLLKYEYIVLGGHFDHNGRHVGILYPGANDNASGSATVMEIARAFSALKQPPLKRSLIFVLFGGEEMGLTGSEYFSKHLPPALKKVDAMFNFDMVGEGDGASCALNPDPPQLEKTLRLADIGVNTLRAVHYIRGVGVRSSDYKFFYLMGAPCISFFSNGPHLHYHKPGDTIYRINPDVMADIARLAFMTAFHWGNR